MNYNILATKESILKTMAALGERGHLAEIAASRSDALTRIKDLINEGATIMNGASRTLEEIGFVEYLKAANHGWLNLHEKILMEKDPTKQNALRKQALLSEFYLGSAHAITESGEIIVASNSGSQLPHLAYTSENIILIVGAQKITKNLDEAIARVKEHVFPLEDARMKEVGMGRSCISKLLIINREQSFSNRQSRIIFVNEKLGF